MIWYSATKGDGRAIVHRTRFRHLRSALATWTVVLIVGLAGRPAAAQTVFRADGVVDLGYTTLTPFNYGSLFVEAGPSLTLQHEAPQLVWRAGYQFLGSLTLTGVQPNSYANQLDLSLAKEVGKESTLIVSATAAQGNTAFQLTQVAPQAGQPAFRAPGNPDIVAATVTESFVWNATPQLRLDQGLVGAMSAPQSSLGQASSSVSASVGLERLFPRDTVGATLSPGLTVLQPLVAGVPEVVIATNSLLGSWNHDFDRHWNAQVGAGVEQVLVLAGGHPTTYVPVGSLSARYLGDASAVSLDLMRAVAANLQTGTESIDDEVALRGSVNLDRVRERQLGASVGLMRADPVGPAIPTDATELGYAVQGDLGLIWGFSSALLATARYSVAYQFGRTASIAPSIIHVVLVGLTVRYDSAPYMPRMPTAGRRVDGGDAVAFPGDARKQ